MHEILKKSGKCWNFFSFSHIWKRVESLLYLRLLNIYICLYLNVCKITNTTAKWNTRSFCFMIFFARKNLKYKQIFSLHHFFSLSLRLIVITFANLASKWTQKDYSLGVTFRFGQIPKYLLFIKPLITNEKKTLFEVDTTKKYFYSSSSIICCLVFFFSFSQKYVVKPKILQKNWT